MAGGQKRDLDIVHPLSSPKRQDVLVAFAGKARLHQPSSALGHDNLLVRRDMIAVGMRHESEPFRVPWIEPQIMAGEVDPPLVANFNHSTKYSETS